MTRDLTPRPPLRHGEGEYALPTWDCGGGLAACPPCPPLSVSERGAGGVRSAATVATRAFGIIFVLLSLLATPALAAPQVPIRVAGLHLETTDGKPFLFLADTCWTGPALSTESEWAEYLADRKAKGFTAIQFNLVSPWRAAPTDRDGRIAYHLEGDALTVNTAFFDQAEARMKAIVDAGLLPVPVLIWANNKGDAGRDLSEANVIKLINYELDRLGKYPALWILAGDTSYRGADGERWKRVGQSVFAGRNLVTTTHPNGENFPWRDWADESWLSVLSYQSGHGDSAKTIKWLTTGPATTFTATKPVINLEPPYEGHNGYSSRKPHSAVSTRRAMYWSLLVTPTAGVTYGGHGIWSWHTRPGQEPTGHKGSGVAKVWRDALNLPFARQLHVIADTFGRVPWTELRPAQTLVTMQPGDADPTKFVAVSATPDRSTIVVYSPTGREGIASVDTKSFAGKSLVLIDPVTEKRVTTTQKTLLADAAKAVSVDGDVILVVGGTP